MNTRTIPFPSARPAFGRTRRADFSPIRSLRAKAPPTDLPDPAADTRIAIEPVAWPRPEVTRPAWHRGALDRMQPELTRFRD
ncbi:hypothetical protein [Opitutus sp. ER46]|uniref:hypothetical protein n=1 Tax=Opitutus sp. ER46 TaxID=2161864 RepID=UPI000D303088|nr:hypothetical protein [Opitutus sp. ER46]PTX90777.1 hypothetical protein DB354_19160 [Opitutus sp. ER46]